jgi:alpha-beta hydrolase superfamily lysophospholipase
VRARLPLALVLAVALVAGVSTRPAAAPATPAAKQPPPLRLKQRCVTKAERRRVVWFPSADGTRLIGVMLGRGDGAVALAHQGASTLCIWVPYARRLAAAGYRVLVYDQRHYGSSAWPRSSVRLFRVDLDAIGAVRELRRRGAKRVVLAGASLGASAVVAAAASARPPVDGVVSLASPSVFVSVDAARAASRLTVPSLFVAAEDDEPFDGDARALYAAAPAADKQLVVVPGPLHGVALLGVPAVRALVDAWIAARLAPG